MPVFPLFAEERERGGGFVGEVADRHHASDLAQFLEAGRGLRDFIEAREEFLFGWLEAAQPVSALIRFGGPDSAKVGGKEFAQVLHGFGRQAIQAAAVGEHLPELIEGVLPVEGEVFDFRKPGGVGKAFGGVALEEDLPFGAGQSDGEHGGDDHRDVGVDGGQGIGAVQKQQHTQGDHDAESIKAAADGRNRCQG